MTYIWIAFSLAVIGVVILLFLPKQQKADEGSVTLSLHCSGEKSRHAKDNIRVDVQLLIIADLSECDDPHIASPSMRNSLEDLLRTKTEEALAIALRADSADFALANHSGLLERIDAAYGEDPTGTKVFWKLEQIELTPISFYDSAHILDSAGLRLLTERRIKAEHEENETRRRREIEEAKRSAEAKS